MASKYFFNGISLLGYRAFASLNIDALKRVNVIGGINGVGKSSLLEVLFSMLDRRNLMSPLRPFTLRSLPAGGDASIRQIFHNQDLGVPARIVANTSAGSLRMEMDYSSIPEKMSFQWNRGPENGFGSSVTFSNQRGLSVKFYENEILTDAHFLLASADGFLGNTYKVGSSRVPTGVYFSSALKNIPSELAAKVSDLTVRRKRDRLVSVARTLNDQVRDFEVFFQANAPFVMAKMADDSFQHVAMLGDGVATLLSIASSMLWMDSGCIFIDEFDGAIHYSKLEEAWKLIISLARETNCQVFVVTHSLECIRYAHSGAVSVGHQDDLQYIRLDKVRHEIVPAIYTADQLGDAISMEWDVR